MNEARYRFPSWRQRLSRRLELLPNEASVWVSPRGDLHAYAAPAFYEWTVPDSPYRAEILAMVKDSPTDEYSGHRPVPVDHIDRLIAIHRELADRALDIDRENRERRNTKAWDDAYRDQRR